MMVKLIYLVGLNLLREFMLLFPVFYRVGWLGFYIFTFVNQLPEFCSKESSLIVKEIFGVAE